MKTKDVHSRNVHPLFICFMTYGQWERYLASIMRREPLQSDRADEHPLLFIPNQLLRPVDEPAVADGIRDSLNFGHQSELETLVICMIWLGRMEGNGHVNRVRLTGLGYPAHQSFRIRITLAGLDFNADGTVEQPVENVPIYPDMLPKGRDLKAVRSLIHTGRNHAKEMKVGHHPGGMKLLGPHVTVCRTEPDVAAPVIQPTGL